MTSQDDDLEFDCGEGSGGGGGPQDTMKRAVAKKRIERYFYQLTDGCGNGGCTNQYCASSGKVVGLSPDQAAGQAIRLFHAKAAMCEAHPAKVARTNDVIVQRTEPPTSNMAAAAAVIGRSSVARHGAPCNSRPAPGRVTLDEASLMRVLDGCRTDGNYAPLIRTLGQVYSSPENLGHSFQRTSPPSPLDAYAPSQLAAMRKEEVRELEGEMEKDEDSTAVEGIGGEGEGRRETDSGSDRISIDLPSLRRAYGQLFSLSSSLYENALVHALITLAENMELDLRVGNCPSLDSLLNALVIALEIPTLGTSDYLDLALPRLCRAAALLPLPAQARLARVWARHCPDRLKDLLETLHQVITARVITGIGDSRYSRDYCVQDEDSITAPTKLMKIIYYANMLAGEMDPPNDGPADDDPMQIDDDFVSSLHKMPKQPQAQDPLSVELKVNVLDCRRPRLPFTEFYNEPLSDAVEMDKDFANYKSGEATGGVGGESHQKFSFMRHSFVLTPATKTLGLYYDNRIRMFSERRISFLQTVVGQPTNPYLRLKVRRDHIIEDALVELEVVALENPKDLKKQLVIEFEGEQGIDEGGVSKEFFQLIVEEIFNPDYGMFTVQQDTQTVWFNTTSFESDAQFTLIGIVLGLAIYNNIILDVHFPMVVYRKLMGKRGTYHDLEDWNKTLHRGLQATLEYEGEEEMSDVFCQTFRVCHTDIFGNVLHHDLRPNGDAVYVDRHNRQEFVDLYADFLLNTSVERQFRAFRRGFQMVTDESPLHLLFRPEEVEQLVCGSKKFDVNELQEVCQYDGGYTADCAVVCWFWQVVHAMTRDDQRRLLQFATGSDRVPVGGLGKLKLIIARNGPDSDRLPTAHTCFNVLLLPEYESKDKLTDRLIKAISYSKGFGML